MKQLRQKREVYLKDTLALWSLSAEMTMLLTFLARNYYSFGTVAQVPSFFLCALGNWMFRELMKPEVELTCERMRIFTATMIVMHLVMIIGLPSEAGMT